MKTSIIDGIGLRGSFVIKHIRNGKVIGTRDVENTTTNTGFAETANLMGDESTPAAFKYLAIGIGTGQDAASTVLSSEITTNGGERDASTVTRVTTTQTDDTLQLVSTWNFTGTFAVTECGMFNATPSAGTMLCVQSFSALNVVSGDSLEITYKVQVA